MPQVISRLLDVPDLAGLTAVASKAVVRKSDNTGWEIRPPALTDQATVFSSTLVASNLSGTNSGDQTITLTGNVTGSGTGSFATTIAAAAVTNAMLAGSIVSSKLIGTDIATVGTIIAGTWTGTTIAIANGGTGQTSANAGFNALSPFTTLGDTLYGGTSGVGTRIPGATSATRQFFTQTGNGTVSAAPLWATILAGDLPNHSAALLTSGLVTLNRGGANADLSATGGAGQYLKQSGVGSALTVGTIATADLPGSFSGFGNPGGTVGLTAVNGTATTAMRSDGAPPISLGIAPTGTSAWTASHQFGAGTADANHRVVIYSPNNDTNHGLKVMANNGTAGLEFGYGGIFSTTAMNVVAGAGSNLTLGGNAAVQLTMSSTLSSFSVPVSTTHIIGNSSAPTIAAGTGAGTGPTIAIVGNDLCLKVTLTTGTLPVVSATVFTVTFNAAYGAAPIPQMTGGNGAAASLNGLSMVYPTTTTTTMVLNSDTTALTASTQYIWYFTLTQ